MNFFRITTPSVDSGHPSELSPVRQESSDQLGINGTIPTHEKIRQAFSNGNDCEVNVSDKLSSEEKDQFDSMNLPNYDGEIKKITQKIYTLTVNSDMKSNGVDLDTHSSSSTGCLSPMSSEGGIYPQELMDNFALNLHR